MNRTKPTAATRTAPANAPAPNPPKNTPEGHDRVEDRLVQLLNLSETLEKEVCSLRDDLQMILQPEEPQDPEGTGLPAPYPITCPAVDRLRSLTNRIADSTHALNLIRSRIRL